jgi:hypothetical protein
VVILFALSMLAVSGIDAAWELVVGVLEDLGDAISSVLFDHVLASLFDWFVTYLFGGSGISLELAFTFVLIGIVAAAYYKYVVCV